MVVGDEFAVAGDEEAGAGGDFLASGVGDDQQHDGGTSFLGEGFEVNRLGLGANHGDQHQARNEKKLPRAAGHGVENRITHGGTI